MENISQIEDDNFLIDGLSQDDVSDDYTHIQMDRNVTEETLEKDEIIQNEKDEIVDKPKSFELLGFSTASGRIQRPTKRNKQMEDLLFGDSSKKSTQEVKEKHQRTERQEIQANAGSPPVDQPCEDFLNGPNMNQKPEGNVFVGGFTTASGKKQVAKSKKQFENLLFGDEFSQTVSSGEELTEKKQPLSSLSTPSPILGHKRKLSTAERILKKRKIAKVSPSSSSITPRKTIRKQKKFRSPIVKRVTNDQPKSLPPIKHSIDCIPFLKWMNIPRSRQNSTEVPFSNLKPDFSLAQVSNHFGISSTTAAGYIFEHCPQDLKQFFQDNKINIQTHYSWQPFQQGLLALNCSKSFVNDDWVRNHYRWIVWKLVSIQRYFSIPSYLNPIRVLSQLLYRYNKEYCLGKRSILLNIARGDANAGVFMVLCVARTQGLEDGRIELTDGWYSMQARVDNNIRHLILSGRIKEGMKLKICNATLSSETRGDPLHIYKTVFLVININSVRRAPWDANLGKQRRLTFRVNIKSLKPSGGEISAIEVVVEKKYPILFMERFEQTNQAPIIRTENSEEKAQSEYFHDKGESFENLHSTALLIVNNRRKESLDIRNCEISSIFDSETLFNLVYTSNDPERMYDQLSNDQKSLCLREFPNLKMKFQEEVKIELEEMSAKQGIETERKVSSFFTCKLRDLCPSTKIDQGDKYCKLTVWNPNEDLLDLFQEGNRLLIARLQTSKSQGEEILSLKTTPATAIHKLGCEALNSKVTDSQDFDNLAYNEEFDCVGTVIYKGDVVQSNKFKSMHYFIGFPNSSKILLLECRESEKRVCNWPTLQINQNYAFENVVYFRKHQLGYYSCYASEISSISMNPKRSEVFKKLDSLQKISSENLEKLIEQCRSYSYKTVKKVCPSPSRAHFTKDYGSFIISPNQPLNVTLSAENNTDSQHGGEYSLPSNELNLPKALKMDSIEDCNSRSWMLSSVSIALNSKTCHETNFTKVQFQEILETLFEKFQTDGTFPEWIEVMRQSGSLMGCDNIPACFPNSRRKIWSGEIFRSEIIIQILSSARIIPMALYSTNEDTLQKVISSSNSKLYFMDSEWNMFVKFFIQLLQAPLWKFMATKEGIQRFEALYSEGNLENLF